MIKLIIGFDNGTDATYEMQGDEYTINGSRFIVRNGEKTLIVNYDRVLWVESTPTEVTE